MFNIDDTLYIFFNQRENTIKYSMINYATENMEKKHLTEIVKNHIYGPENNLIKNLSEKEIESILHS